VFDDSLGGALLTPIPWLNKSNGDTHSPLEGEVKTESTEMVEGPNGPGGVETVSVSVNGVSSTRGGPSPTSPPGEGSGTAGLRAEGGVTQGELLRQEQQAGVVPISQLEGSRGDADGLGEEDEAPHARGPEEIGMEDMGPQGNGSASQRGGPGVAMQGIDVEAAVGRKADNNKEDTPEEEPAASEPEAETPTTPKREAGEDLGADEKRIKTASEEEAAAGAAEDTPITDAPSPPPPSTSSSNPPNDPSAPI